MILVLAFAGAGLFMKYHYKDIVESKIKTELNNRIIPDIYTNIDFTVFKTFPDASVVFYNTTIADPLRKDSVLLEAEKIYFRFNLIDLIREKYRLSRIDMINGKMNLYVDENGNENFDIIRQKTDSVKEALSLELEKILLRNIQINYDDEKSENYISAEVERATAKGKFGDKDFDLETSGNFHLKQYKLEENVLAENDNLIVDLVMNVSPTAGKFALSSGQIEFNSVPLEVSGAVDYRKETLVDVRLVSPALDMNSIMDDLPDDIADKLNPYAFAGEPFINIHLNGGYGGSANPHIEANFGLSHGKVEHRESGIEASALSLKGSFTNGNANNAATSILRVQELKGVFAGRDFTGEFSIKNLDKPEITLSANTVLDLQKIKEFASLDTLETATGSLKVDIDFSFTPGNINQITASDLMRSKSEGDIYLQNVDVKLKGNNAILRKVNGRLSFNSRDVAIQSLEGKINRKNDFTLNGFAENLLPFLFFKDQQLKIVADLHSAYLSLDDLLKQTEGMESNENGEYRLELPAHISCIFNMEIDALDFRRFHGEEVAGEAILKNQVLHLKNLRLKSMDGSILAKGTVNAAGDQVKVTGNAYFSKVKIDKAFYQLENLNQEALTHEHISGFLTSEMSFSASFTHELKPVSKTFALEAALKIEQGELVNFEPLRDLSRFLRVADLSKIKFETLENDISIKNEKITIPRMEVRSSAADFKLAGQHTFKNNIDYHLEVLLSEILSRKAKKKTENNEFGRIEDDGLGRTTLFLKIYGTVENPKFAYDTQGLKKKLEKDLKEEKKELKQVMHDELGMFRGDSTVKQKPKTERQLEKEKKKQEKEEEEKQLEEREKGKFIIEWEEE